jgi:1,4-dihydroxy-2-naphthoate octaprenyltransferase
LFFGFAAVCGTYYVQAGTVALTVWISALPVGALAMAILLVNNLRDIDTDRAAGKKTLAVRFGANAAKWEYILFLAVAYLTPIILTILDRDSVWTLLTWVSIPLAVPLVNRVRNEHGRALNLALAGTARLEFIYAILFALGLILARAF